VIVVPSDKPVVRALDRQNGEARWETFLPAKLESGPMLESDLVLVGTSDDKVVALDRTTGKVRWQTQLEIMKTFWADNDKRTRVNLTVDGGRLLVTTHGKGPKGAFGRLYSLDLTTGAKQWDRPLEGGAVGPAQIMGERILVGSFARYYAFRNLPGQEGDGVEAWNVPLKGDQDAGIGVEADGIYAFSYSYAGYVVDLKDGKTLWTSKSKLPPATDGHRVLWREAQWSGTTFTALEARSDTQVWERKLPKFEMPWVQDGLIFAGMDKEIVALKVSDGQDAWRFTLPKDLTQPPVLLGDRVLAWVKQSGQSLIYGLEPKTGKVAWTFTVAVKPGQGMIHADAQGILFPGEDGMLICLK